MLDQATCVMDMTQTFRASACKTAGRPPALSRIYRVADGFPEATASPGRGLAAPAETGIRDRFGGAGRQVDVV
jgi:hypothetical protein